jgi:hypothetical protein
LHSCLHYPTILRVTKSHYRDFLAELIDTQFGSRQEFCQATAIDPGQLSRVLANRADLSMKVLQNVLEVLHARLVVQGEEDSRTTMSVERAAEVIEMANGQRMGVSVRKGEGASSLSGQGASGML